MNIILDAMGGDNAPNEIVKGAVMALRDFSDINIIFTGKESQILTCLEAEGFLEDRVSIINTTQVIDMCDSPTGSLKTKKDSSMVVGLEMLAAGRGDVFVTAGNTGAFVAGSTIIVKRAQGVKRPALAPVLPATTGGVLLIDCGANVDSKPEYLKQFGIMGSIYMNKVMGIQNPRVALINNGSEEEKGCALTKEAYQLLKNTNINFIGNVEGRDVLLGGQDVLVCDGFLGNVIMKFLEGTAGMLISMLKSEMEKGDIPIEAANPMKMAMLNLKKKMDYTEYGGALLLGVNKGVVKAHGSSRAKAIASAVRQARLLTLGDTVEIIKKEILKSEMI